MATQVKKQSLYPECLLEDLGLEPGERQWWAVYTKVRQEKQLAHELWRYKIPFYLPLVARNHFYRGRQVRSHVPLFTGYVFLFASLSERYQSLTTNRISQVLPVADGRQLCHDLLQVHRLIESDVPLTVERRISPGQRVRIRHGSMAGLEGTVLSRSRQTKLLVAVQFMQQGVSIEMDDFMLEPLT